MNTIYISASSVSAFAGRHKYKSQEEAFREVLYENKEFLKRVTSALDEEELVYRPVLEALNIPFQEEKGAKQSALKLVEQGNEHGERVRREVEARQVNKEDIETLRKRKPETLAVVRETVSKIRQLPGHSAVTQERVLTATLQEAACKTTTNAVNEVVKDKGLDQLSSQTLQKKIASTWVRDRGTQLEKDVAGYLRQKCPSAKKVCFQTFLPRLTLSLPPPDKYNVVVKSRADFVYKDSEDACDTVFEVKNRRNKFFVPSYDLDQLCLYTVASSAQRGNLIEQCQGVVKESYTMTLQEATERLESCIKGPLFDSVLKFFDAVEHPEKYMKIWADLRLATTVA